MSVKTTHIGVVTTGHGPRDEYLHYHRIFLESLGADVRITVRHIYEDLTLEQLLPHQVDKTKPNLGAHVHVPGAVGNHMGDGWEHRFFELGFATELVQKTIDRLEQEDHVDMVLLACAAEFPHGAISAGTLLIHPRLGSWLLLGGFLTTMDLKPATETVADHCGSCTRCIEACPTDAITPYSVDARRCISYLTIERREAIAAEFHGAIGDWIFGCDICQEVCPHNSPRPGMTSEEPRASYRSGARSFDLLEVLNWDAKARQEALKTSPLKRIKLEQFRRNAATAAGNALQEHALPELRARLTEIASDDSEPELVRRAASGALGDRGCP